MTPYRRCLIGLLVMFAALFTIAVAQDTNVSSVVATNAAVATNNAVSTNAVASLPPGLDQVADLFGPKAKAFLARVIVWIGSLSLMLGFFGNKISNWLRDKLNRQAEMSGSDADKWLAALFANPLYRIITTAFRFVSVNFPTSDDLERALRFQREAVIESGGTPKPTIPT